MTSVNPECIPDQVELTESGKYKLGLFATLKYAYAK